jgi:hypothetical protein
VTTYFDKAHNELSLAANLNDWPRLKVLNPVEEKAVFDCTIAAMQSGFPEALRLKVHQVVLRHGVNMLPLNATPADFETIEQHERKIHDLIWQ